MRNFLLTAMVLALASAMAIGGASHVALSAAARAGTAAAIRDLQRDNANLRIELDTMRRELMRRPVPPAKGPAVNDPDRIPPTELPTTPKE